MSSSVHSCIWYSLSWWRRKRAERKCKNQGQNINFTWLREHMSKSDWMINKFFFFICFLLLWGKQPTSMSQPMGCITWLKQVSHFHQWVYYQKSDTQNCDEIIIHILKHKNQKDQIERSMFDWWWFTSFIHGNTATIRKQFFNMTLK